VGGRTGVVGTAPDAPAEGVAAQRQRRRVVVDRLLGVAQGLVIADRADLPDHPQPGVVVVGDRFAASEAQRAGADDLGRALERVQARAGPLEARAVARDRAADARALVFTDVAVAAAAVAGAQAGGFLAAAIIEPVGQ